MFKKLTLYLSFFALVNAEDFSLRFDGEDYVAISNSSSFLNDAISISMWVYLDNAPSSSESYLLFKGTDTGAPYTWIIEIGV